MTINEARALGQRVVDRVLALPLLVILAAAAGLIAAALLVAIGMSGPPYQALFEGLAPAQGGAIITQLQKLGIPYRLERAGTIISVPAPDVGLARLQLAATGVPDTSSGGSWKALENAPMTASQPAVDAMRLQALQDSLEQTIQNVSGATEVHVMVALPRDTPFLATQPKVKASVVMTGVAQPDEGLGLAVAELVSGAVPGLDQQDVVVATGGGQILYPVSSNLSANRDIAIQSRVEASEEAKIRSLLTPLFGAAEFRVAVSADVKFADQTIQSVVYGPKTYAVSSNTESSKQVGHPNVPFGIPGALSNQPPGPTTAPVNNPAPAANGAAAAGTTAGATNAAANPPEPPQPVSTSERGQTQYDIDETRSETHPAGWDVTGITVSVLVDKPAMAATTPAAVQQLIAATTTMPVKTIEVMTAQFAPASVPVPAARGSLYPTLLRAALYVAAAVALLFGFLIPSMRWMARIKVSPPSRATPDVLSLQQEDPAVIEARRSLDQAVIQVRSAAKNQPAVVARTLQKWLEQTPA
jgi:flagellar M-ring protein FliF